MSRTMIFFPTNGDQPADRDDAKDGTEPMKDPGDTIDPPAGSDNGGKSG